LREASLNIKELFINTICAIRASVAKTYDMADISSNFLGIKSPNPFWLASAPPTDKKLNVMRAYEAGWGGVVWKHWAVR